MVNEYQIKEQICEIGRRIDARGLVAANDGNISVRVNGREVLCTPTGVLKGTMTPEMICKMDLDGNVLEAPNGYKPSSEMKMHIRVYQKRDDINAVVHAHPPYATSFAVAGIPLSQPILSEAVLQMGCVPIADYGTPSTKEIPDAVEKYLPYFDAMLLEYHGALAYGNTLMNAYMKMESVEFYARTLFQVKVIGGGSAREIPREKVEALYELRRRLGMPGRHPATVCQNQGTANCHNCGLHAMELSGVTRQAQPAAGMPAPGAGETLDAGAIASITREVMASLGIRQ